MGVPILILWFAVAGTGVAVFALLCWKKGIQGAGIGIPALLGAPASYGLVSAALGILEQFWSRGSLGFWIAVLIGLAGVGGIAFSSVYAFRLTTNVGKVGQA